MKRFVGQLFSTAFCLVIVLSLAWSGICLVAFLRQPVITYLPAPAPPSGVTY